MGNRAAADPWEVLGLPHSASKEEVKAAFRRLALKCHPDVDPSPQAAARFTEVKRAADCLLKGHHPAAAAGPGPASAYSAWQAYASARASHAGDWRPRSRHAALWLCFASLAGGFGIFWGALVSHEWLNGYRWLTPEVADNRLKHPTPRRQHLMQLMMQERQERRAAASAPEAEGLGSHEAAN